MVDLTHVPHSPEINLAGLVDDDYADCVKLASEVVAGAFASKESWMISQPSISLPVMWNFGGDPEDGIGGPPVDDPLVIYVGLPLSGYDDQVTYRSSLQEIVEEIISEDDHSILPPIAKALRDLADKIDASYDPDQTSAE